jgi:hypothetical protein
MKGYSNDLSAIVKGDLPAREMLKNIKKSEEEVGIGININKLAIMKIIPSIKYKQNREEAFLGIPRFESNKYLKI